MQPKRELPVIMRIPRVKSETPAPKPVPFTLPFSINHLTVLAALPLVSLACYLCWQMAATPTDFTPPSRSADQRVNAKMSHSSLTEPTAPSGPEFQFSMPDLPRNDAATEAPRLAHHDRHDDDDHPSHSNSPEGRRTWIVGRVGVQNNVTEHKTVDRSDSAETSPAPRIRIESVFPVRPPDNEDQ